MINVSPRTSPEDGRPASGDAFERMDTAPLDLSDLHRPPLSGRNSYSQAAPDLPALRRRHWPITVAAVLLVACVAVLCFVLLLPRGANPSQPSAGSGAATSTPTTARAGVADTGWQNLELNGAWYATGDGARFRVRDGVCYLQVHVSVPSGTWAANTEIGVLPPSVAPAWNLGFVSVRAGQPFGEVGVFSSGRILVVAPSTAPGGDITVSGAFPVG
jgi:hypothetical protein